MLSLSFCIWCVTGDETLGDGTTWGVESLAAPKPRIQVQNDPGTRQWLHPWTLSAKQIVGLSISMVVSDSADIGRSQIPHGRGVLWQCEDTQYPWDMGQPVLGSLENFVSLTWSLRSKACLKVAG